MAVQEAPQNFAFPLREVDFVIRETTGDEIAIVGCKNVSEHAGQHLFSTHYDKERQREGFARKVAYEIAVGSGPEDAATIGKIEIVGQHCNATVGDFVAHLTKSFEVLLGHSADVCNDELGVALFAYQRQKAAEVPSFSGYNEVFGIQRLAKALPMQGATSNQCD